MLEVHYSLQSNPPTSSGVLQVYCRSKYQFRQQCNSCYGTARRKASTNVWRHLQIIQSNKPISSSPIHYNQNANFLILESGNPEKWTTNLGYFATWNWPTLRHAQDGESQPELDLAAVSACARILCPHSPCTNNVLDARLYNTGIKRAQITFTCIMCGEPGRDTRPLSWLAFTSVPFPPQYFVSCVFFTPPVLSPPFIHCPLFHCQVFFYTHTYNLQRTTRMRIGISR